MQHLQLAPAQSLAGDANTRTPSVSVTSLSIKITRTRKERYIWVSDGAGLSIYTNESRPIFLKTKSGTLRESLKAHLHMAFGSSASPFGKDSQIKKHRHQLSNTTRSKNNSNPLYSRLEQKSLSKATSSGVLQWRMVASKTPRNEKPTLRMGSSVSFNSSSESLIRMDRQEHNYNIPKNNTYYTQIFVEYLRMRYANKHDFPMAIPNATATPIKKTKSLAIPGLHFRNREAYFETLMNYIYSNQSTNITLNKTHSKATTPSIIPYPQQIIPPLEGPAFTEFAHYKLFIERKGEYIHDPTGKSKDPASLSPAASNFTHIFFPHLQRHPTPPPTSIHIINILLYRMMEQISGNNIDFSVEGSKLYLESKRNSTPKWKAHMQIHKSQIPFLKKCNDMFSSVATITYTYI